jgi:hypothetical protein
MIKMKINFNFITMMLIKHISNMYSRTFLKNKGILFYFLSYPILYK